MSKLPIALQLYTVRDETAKDFAGTLKKVAEIGFAGVELAGRGDLSVQALRSLLDDNNLKVAGSHVSIDELEKDIAKVIDENLSLGNAYVIVPYLGEDRRADGAAYKTIAAKLGELGETLRTHGLTLAYHNHDFEFQKFDGEYGLDLIFDNTNAQVVKAEIDTCWVFAAGVDPVAYLQKFHGRAPLLHIKDWKQSEKALTEVGTGDLPLAGILAAATEIGTEWLIVEHDAPTIPSLESAKISFENLKARQ
ncbi:sugar phosphate isomerase [Capsulimonas corticalis]|uniref:Sugar phosphate isomerase n=1 Tax=Capsulimonas corticalis TaxID=2219043 RepID=A0A402D012_9BACT|nr:sugar phosphate isomerase/epimerase [Capsulimonas corticalis]BDI33784.1 sugar phosphate isomerase [Capsulimonas corticalis]